MAPSIGVSEYYAGKTIFITGATGFIGKVLVEKLLRCCPDLKRIYLLMRPKRGQNAKERLSEFTNCRAFDYLQDKSPESFDKITVIQGDILLEDLGISMQDRDLCQKETEIIFHCAACVRFDMFIRDALDMNTVGTLKVLKLADGMKNLEVFVHVSTSYCHNGVHTLEERIYPSKHRPQDIMKCMQWMDDDLLNCLQSKLIEPEPNTYGYTKALTEDLVSQHAGKFPIVIARPSIVTASYKEPIPGWVDNMNGATGIMIGAGKGVIRSMHCNETYLADVIPVDMVVNACILLSYINGLEKPKEIKVCNITQSGYHPITWGRALALGRYHIQEFPSSVCLWYPGGSPKKSKLHHSIVAFFVHTLPAYFVDFIMLLIGKKTFMVKVQKRISDGLEVLQYYTTKEWYFRNDYYISLPKQISEIDNEIFYTNLKASKKKCVYSVLCSLVPRTMDKYATALDFVLNWSDYIRDYIKGTRDFCLKEDPSTLPQARNQQKKLYYLDKTVQFLSYSLIVYFIYCYIIKYFC